MFQKEKEMETEKEMEKETEMEEETRSPSKWRTARDSPEQGITLVFAGVRGECCSMGLPTRIFGLKIFGQDQQNRTWLLNSASDGGHIRRSVPRA